MHALKRALVGMLLVGSLAGLGWAPAAADETRAVIERQLEAFQLDDWSSAFEYASPSIQQKFGGPEVFGRMVREGYPMVWRPSIVDFLGGEPTDGGVIERLQIIDSAGQEYIAEYRMIQVDGFWRIAGVRIEKAPVGGV